MLIVPSTLCGSWCCRNRLQSQIHHRPNLPLWKCVGSHRQSSLLPILERPSSTPKLWICLLCWYRMLGIPCRLQLCSLCRWAWQWPVSRILGNRYLLIDRRRVQRGFDKRTCFDLQIQGFRKLFLIIEDQQYHWDHRRRYRRPSWCPWLLQEGW